MRKNFLRLGALALVSIMSIDSWAQYVGDEITIEGKGTYKVLKVEAEPGDGEAKGTVALTKALSADASLTTIQDYYEKSFSVTQIAEGAYQSLPLESTANIIVPANIKKIGTDAFNNVNITVSFAGSIEDTELCEYAFRGATFAAFTEGKTFEYVFKNAKIENYAFSGADLSNLGNNIDLKNITLSKGAFKGATFANNTVISVAGNLPEEVFQGCKKILTVKFFNGLGIGDHAFDGCTTLTTFEFDSDNGDFAAIGKYAFNGCTNLAKFGYLYRSVYTLPSKLTTVDDYAFYNCSKLPNTFGFVNKGAGKISYVGKYAFLGCKLLSNETFCNLFNTSYDGEVLSFDNVQFGEYSFSGITALTGTMSLKGAKDLEGNAMTSVPVSVFEGCTGITGYVLPEQCTTIGEKAFYNTKIDEIILPEGLETVGDNAFYTTSAQTYQQDALYLPSALQSIGNNAFGVKNSGSRTFTTVYANPDVTDPTSIPTIHATQTNLKIGKVVVPVIDPYVVESVNKTLKDAYSAWKFNDTTFEFASASAPDGCYTYDGVNYTLGAQDDYGFYKLTPTSYTEATPTVYGVFDNTVSEFKDLKSVGTEEGNASLYKLYCYVVAPSAQMTVESGDVKVSSITFSPGVINGESTDDGYAMGKVFTTVGRFFIPDNARNITDTKIYNFNKVTVNEGITEIEQNAFKDIQTLTSVTLPSTLTTIGKSAFNGCTKLSTAFTIKVPKGGAASLATIEEKAFAGCTSLKNLTLPASLTAIGDNAFDGDDKLTAITLPENLASVGAYAFAGTGITSIELPKSLVTIGNFAFSSVKKQVSVSYETIPELPGDAFAYKVIKEATDTDEAEYDDSHFAATLVVDGDRSAYTSKDYWKNFFGNTGTFTVVKDDEVQTVCEDENGVFVFNDAVTSVNVANQIGDEDSPVTVQYKRTFSNTKWQAISLPFDVPVETINDNGLEVAELYNVSLNPETGDLVAVVWVKLKNDKTMEANKPYVIKANVADDKSIKLETVVEPTKSLTVDCSSTKELYTLTSNYDATNMWTKKGYYLGGGNFNWTNAEQQEILKPYRFYLTRKERPSKKLIYGPWTKDETSSVKVVVLDDEEEAATYINSLSVRDAENLSAPMYDVTGRQIVSPVKGQVYIQNGVKKLAK